MGSFTGCLFWILLGSLLLLLISWVSCCPQHEQKSLLEFKGNLDDPSGRLETWNDSTSCCNWEGIECDNITKHVILLDLHNPFANDLERALQSTSGVTIFFGSLSVVESNTKDVLSSLFNLKMLQVLDLSYNSFSGVAIPQQLPTLKYLRYLNLSNAGFEGKVPRELGNMSTLRYLDLSTDLFISISSIKIDDMQMWIGNMRNLEVLLLDEVNMALVTSDEWGKAICTMYNLKRLQMSNCELSGPIPPSLANLTLLTHLQLGENSFFSHIPAGLHNLSNLVSFNLGNCELNGSIPSGLLSLPNLREVDLSGNFDLGGDLRSILPRHSASLLKSLVLAATSVGGAIPDSIDNISSLTHLDLSDCYVQGMLPHAIVNLRGLVMLDISHNFVEGSIPPFGDKTPTGSSFSLAHIDLSYNQLVGHISPILFGAFRNLRYVHLRKNRLTGDIPSPARNLTFLTHLDLSYNELSGTIPSLTNIKSLVLLDLGNNHLTGKIQDSIGQLTSLRTLDLSNNKLTDVIPKNISNLSQLKVLSLSSNLLSGNLSEFYLHNLSRLVHLDISNNMFNVKVSATWIPQNSFSTLKLRSCNLEGELPAFLITQTGISNLDLSENRLWGNIPAWIWDSPALIQLNLSYNNFSGALPSDLRIRSKRLKILDLHHNNLQGPLPLPSLSMVGLDLSENQFSASIPAEIGEYYLWFLLLSHNNLSGSIPSRLCETPSHHMRILDFSYNSLSGKIPPIFANCTELVVLNLEENCLEGELPAELGNMISLQTIKVTGNRLNGTLPTLANCKQLQILDAGDNRLTGNISSSGIQELPNLKILILRSNRFEGTLPASFKEIPSIQILDLSMNSFSGVIPDSISEMKGMGKDSLNSTIFEFGNMTGSTYVEKIVIRNKGNNMEYVKILRLVKCLDLSSNRISGHIPEGIGSLTGLIILNLSMNHISGAIPESLGNMVQLESLDLSQNQLSGFIPTELQSLTFLSYLNLSYNNLRGPIPQGAQFATFEASSFSHNPGLYGFQLNECCYNLDFNKRCITSPPPPQSVDESDEDEDEMWWGAAVGLSFAFGFSLVIGILCLTTTLGGKGIHLMDRAIVFLFDRFRN